MTIRRDPSSAREAGTEPVVLRTSWPRIITAALSLPAGATLGLFLASVSDGRPVPVGISTGALGAVVAYFALVSGGSAWLQRRNRLVLAAGELTVRNGFRSHVLAAADVQAVTLEREYGTRTVKLWLADGTYRRATAAGRTQGLLRQNFDRDYHLVGDWWLANRGPHWQPRPAADRGPRLAPHAPHAPVPLDFDWNPGS